VNQDTDESICSFSVRVEGRRVQRREGSEVATTAYDEGEKTRRAVMEYEGRETKIRLEGCLISARDLSLRHPSRSKH
jgi:hypothetical protein